MRVQRSTCIAYIKFPKTAILAKAPSIAIFSLWALNSWTASFEYCVVLSSVDFHCVCDCKKNSCDNKFHIQILNIIKETRTST